MKTNTVIVRKCKNHRVFVNAFSLIAVALITICVVSLKSFPAFLLCIPILLITVPLVLYYSTWQLCFEEQFILKRYFFREVSRHSYGQLREVVQRYYVSERDICIIMNFTDGKKILFRTDDDHAAQAVRKLQQHRSITIK